MRQRHFAPASASTHRPLSIPAAAKKAIRELFVRRHNGLDSALEYAEIAMAQRHWPEAVKRWRAIIETHGEKAPVVAYFRLGRAHRLSGDLAGAEAAVRQGLARYGGDVGLVIEHAEIAMAQRDWPEAVKRWRVVIDTHGQNAPVAAYSRLARAHRLKGEFAEAEATIRAGLACHGNDASLAVEHAEIAMAQRDWPEAISRWRTMLESDGGNAPAAAYSRLARAHRFSGDLAAAEAAIRDGLARQGNDASLAVEHAEIAMAQYDWPEAISRWRGVIERHGDDAPPIVHRRLQQAQKGRAAPIGGAERRDRPINQPREGKDRNGGGRGGLSSDVSNDYRALCIIVESLATVAAQRSGDAEGFAAQIGDRARQAIGELSPSSIDIVAIKGKVEEMVEEIECQARRQLSGEEILYRVAALVRGQNPKEGFEEGGPVGPRDTSMGDLEERRTNTT
jgi:lipopolysaccharide biosynthesis regulator YciM